MSTPGREEFGGVGDIDRALAGPNYVPEPVDRPQEPGRPSVVDKVLHFFGKMIGGGGRRMGERDTDPGS